MVDCKTCLQRFAVKRREQTSGKSTDALKPGARAGEFECPHCHDIHSYTTDDLIPGEGRIQA
jgi:hypothetical protein